jgi:hypothetical protein
MRQGQQNRRGRSRSGSGTGSSSGSGNSTNNNRKGQNPLSRTYESNGPDVKIRGTASQIAEKYSTLARDASSSSDTVMAENYLQHAEHYNRIIMAAQTQTMQPADQNDGEPGQAVNGVHRGARDGNHTMRDQAQHEANVASPQERRPQAAAASEQQSVEQPSIDERPMTEQSAATPTEAKQDAAADESNSETEQGRRRRRRYPGGNGAGRSAAAEGEGDKTADAPGDDRSPDEVTA